MNYRRLVILHGYTASPDSHWFEWLREECSADGTEVRIPALPESDSPSPRRWFDTARSAIGALDPGTAVVGHSLGCITALHAIDEIGARQPGWRLGALVLVSGFAEPVPGLPELDAFVETVPDLGALAGRIASRTVIRSDDDRVVPPPLTSRLAASLDATEVVVAGAGHFLAREGSTELPEAARALRGRLLR